jgi:hypothetical protein
MSMRLKTMFAAVVAAGTLAAIPSAVQARPLTNPVAVSAKTCSSGFVYAVINSQQKCLRHGEFCTHAYDHRAPRRWPYSHYGFRCVRYYSNVERYRLT